MFCDCFVGVFFVVSGVRHKLCRRELYSVCELHLGELMNANAEGWMQGFLTDEIHQMHKDLGDISKERREHDREAEDCRRSDLSRSRPRASRKPQRRPARHTNQAMMLAQDLMYSGVLCAYEMSCDEIQRNVKERHADSATLMMNAVPVSLPNRPRCIQNDHISRLGV